MSASIDTLGETRRQWLAHAAHGAFAVVVGSAQGADPRVLETTDPGLRSVLDGAIDYLRRAQAPDGRWASGTYAVLRSGQALTPFVLSALLDADPSQAERDETKRALDWMESQTREGTLGLADPELLEYPVFATAFALQCLVKVNRSGFEHRIAAVRQALLGQQFSEARGFQPEHLAYGGWGFGGFQPPGQTGHMDLAHTRWALSALSASDPPSATPLPHQLKAQRLLRLLQKHPAEDRAQPLGDGRIQQKAAFDGGFYFSPIVLAANKGRVLEQPDRPAFRSYATATCDGLLALLASGVDPTDERVLAARRWLESHPHWDHPAGIPRRYPEPWGDAVYFYHQAVRGEAYGSLGLKGDWAKNVGSRLKLHKRGDGSFVNLRSSLMKENDPILCSALALMAATCAVRRRGANTY